MIAGPCSVESEAHIVALAKLLKARGATGLRGGAFKPRTSPYSFQGHKEDGLKMLAAARDATGLAIVTEVMAPEHVPMVAKYADVLQIGARNMQNYQLLQAVGDCGKPALLKRGMSATIDEFLLAAEYILDRGNPNVMLCERGIRTYEEHTRFTLPLATVPYLHAEEPPAGGRRSLARDGQGRARRAHGQGGHRLRGRRPDRRGPRRPRARHERRVADDHPRRLRPDDGRMPPRGRGGGSNFVSCQLSVVSRTSMHDLIASTNGLTTEN